MKKLLIGFMLLLFCSSGSAQMIVNDPLAIGQRLAQLGELAAEIRATTDIYNQNKDWFDGLKKVAGMLKNYQKVKESLEMTKAIAYLYKNNVKRFSADKNFSAAEIIAIQKGYLKLLKESSRLVDELVFGAKSTDLKLTDKERYDIINNMYERIREHKQLVEYYTRKHIQVSYLRAQKSGDTKRVLRLYGLNN